MLLVSCVVVPCVFSTRVDAVFAIPKLVALWAALALVLALVAAGVVASGRLPELRGVVVGVDVAVAIFVLLNLAAWAFSSDRSQSLYGERLQYQGLLSVLLYAGFYAAGRSALTSERRVWLLAAAATAGGALVAAYAIAQRAGLDPIWEGFLPGGRVFSSIGQSNALAAYLVLVLPLAGALAVAFGRRVRIAASVAVALIATAFVLTLSRGGFLGFLAAAAVLAVGARRRLRARPRLVALVAASALVAGIAAVVLVDPLRARVEVAGESFRFHVDAWHVAARIAAEHPALGTGQETFPDQFPRWSHEVLPPDRAAALDRFRVESPHNVYLAIAAGAGLPALAAYLAAVAGCVATLVAAIRRRPPASAVLPLALLAAIVGHVVTDAFMTAEVTSTWLFWLLLAAAVTALRAPPSAA